MLEVSLRVSNQGHNPLSVCQRVPMSRPLTLVAPFALLLALASGCNWFAPGPPPDPPNLPTPKPAETPSVAAPPPTKWLFGKPVGEWNMSEAAADALRRIGQPAVRPLISYLSDPDRAMRLQAAQILSGIGPEAAEAVPALRQCLQDPDPEVRKWAARALGQIGPAAASAVPELMEAVRPGKT